MCITKQSYVSIAPVFKPAFSLICLRMYVHVCMGGGFKPLIPIESGLEHVCLTKYYTCLSRMGLIHVRVRVHVRVCI